MSLVRFNVERALIAGCNLLTINRFLNHFIGNELTKPNYSLGWKGLFDMVKTANKFMWFENYLHYDIIY
jgi:hypothetical protein